MSTPPDRLIKAWNSALQLQHDLSERGQRLAEDTDRSMRELMARIERDRRRRNRNSERRKLALCSPRARATPRPAY